MDTINLGKIKILSSNLLNLIIEKDSSVVVLGSIDGNNFTGKREKTEEKFRLIKK